jgi:CDP-diacylglycerol pyrophosphatase
VTRALAWLLALAGCAAPEPPPAPGRDGLYRQMRACLAQARPAPPCARVDRARGFVVIRDDDPAKPDAWLIVPATEVTGIEDPRALRPPVAELWAYGWEVAGELLDRPPQAMALAINSNAGRSQDLLHIHISCVLPEVAAGLARAPVGPDWAAAPFLSFDGHPYNAHRVAGLEPSPFLVLRELPGARSDMGAQSLAVIGASGGGFYLVTDATGPGVVAEAEELLDQDCR